MKLLLIALCVVVLLVFLLGDSLIFFPSKYPTGSWEYVKTAGFPIEEIAFKTKSGANCHAWLAKRDDAPFTFLISHGNGGNITNRTELTRLLREMPGSVLIFDYPGYGKSDGSPNEKGCYESAEAAYEWLRTQGTEAKRIVLYGESLGGAVAVELAKRVPVGGIILQATFTSIPDMAKHVVPFLPLGWAVRSKFDSESKIAALTVPKLFFHSKPDEVVPYSVGKKLFDAAAQPKRWVEFEDLRHNEWPSHREKEWREAIQELLQEIEK